ncbi:unnamed protein product [Pseudo-nitzschia multistriata]|uniref:Uncharacterized protein n=1 Tax=Pseudo-nitzschia multistriata TaxID=183589 RepID=A0A448Z3A9_9STRA|nr:unnamed protein product [Pseudo-nitzschia multistriata]
MSDSGSPYDTMPPTSSSSSSTGTAEGVALWATTLLLVVVSSLVWLRFRDRAWHVPAVTKEGSEAKRVPDAGDDGDGDIRSHGASDALVRAGDGEIDDDDDDDDMDFGEYDVVFAVDGSLLAGAASKGSALLRDLVESTRSAPAAPASPQRRSRRIRSLDPDHKTRVETKIREFYDTIAKHEGRYFKTEIREEKKQKKYMMCQEVCGLTAFVAFVERGIWFSYIGRKNYLI